MTALPDPGGMVSRAMQLSGRLGFRVDARAVNGDSVIDPGWVVVAANDLAELADRLDADWTMSRNGYANSSPKFVEVVAAVERLIRRDAATLLAGRADVTARLIVAQIAHIHGLAPREGLRGEEG